MAKITYVGSGDETDDRQTTVFGLTFVQGEPVEVADAKIAAKLAVNPVFKAAEGRKPKAAEPDAQ